MPPKFIKKKYDNTITIRNKNAIFLIIVESPSKCAKIEHFLGSNYSCIASLGHLRYIKGLKSIDTKKTFEPTFDIIDDKKDHIKRMENIISQYQPENIFLATDDDREGEGIAWHICDLFNLSLNTKRILFHEITKTAIINAVNNPTKINMSLVMAQQTRQILDVIVGYKISPFLWKYLYNNKDNSLSAGRCQTPALRLIYENEKDNTKDLIKSYKTIGSFTQKKLLFQLNENFEEENMVNQFLNLSCDFQHKMDIGSQTTSNKSPPVPFCTSKLLQTANSVIQMSPKETMSLCQQLYQGGYITYMRTESTQYSKDFLEKMKKYICDKYDSSYLGDINKLTNANSENPHEAIRVTQIELKTIPDCKNNRMNTLYKLIWRTTIQSCMAIAIYYQNKITISAPLDKQYRTTLESPKFLGWKIIENKQIDIAEDDKEILMYLNNLVMTNQKIIYNEINSEVSCKKNHSYYTEASLIHKLETLEIGRPSTYSTIVETIKERGYVKKMDVIGEKIVCNDYCLKRNKIEKKINEKVFGNEKNKLIIQPIGIVALEFLTNYFDKIFSYEYTKTMEQQLDLISNNKIENWNIICSNCYNELKELSKSIKDVKKQSYNICDGYEFIFEKYGPVIKHTLEDGNIEYLPGNNEIDIDLNKLKQKKYELHELLDNSTQCLGTYENEDIYIKNGRYGYYVEWGENRESIKTIKTPINEIDIEVITKFLQDKKENKVDNSVLRVLNDSMSVRKGKFGPYVFYRTKEMKKPRFLNIKKFTEGFLKCDENTLVEWLCQEYNIQIDNL